MAKLKPAYFLDLDPYTLTRKLLSKPDSRDVWEEVVSDLSYEGGRFDMPKRDSDLLQVSSYSSKNLKKVDPLSLSKVLVAYVESVVAHWTHQSNDISASVLLQSLPVFVEMSKTIPFVNPAGKYQAAFRGTEIRDEKLHAFIKKTKPEDWKRTKLAGDVYMAYTGPLKNGFIYKPHRAVQSWSVSDKAAKGFGESIITTNLDNSFFFDPSFTGEFGYKHEKETIHFGNKPMKVALMVHKADYDNFRELKRVDETNINEETEIHDSEGTLTIPGI